jgi:hypothetical protein
MGARPVRDGEPQPPWCIGAARFDVGINRNGARLIVAARCRLGTLKTEALLDTGAEWSIFGGELAEDLEQEADEESRDIVMDTRLGCVDSRLYRLDVALLADEGDDLVISASVLLAPSWEGPPVLGYRGFLERIRFGLDPGLGNSEEQWFFFGSAS